MRTAPSLNSGSYFLRVSGMTTPHSACLHGFGGCPSLEFLDYGVGGQHYGTLDGWLRGEDVRGELRLTNLAPRRSDNVNLPTLRGLLTTEDDALVYVEMNGIATLRPADDARVFVTSLT